MIIITVVDVVDDDTYYWVYMSSDQTFQIYYKVRQLLLQSATAYFITKCDGLLLQSATAFLLQSAIRITKCHRTPSCLRYFFFFSGFIFVLLTRLAEFILETNYLSRRIIRLEFDENLSRYFTRVAKI